MTTRDVSENSVTSSLAEIERLEAQRQRDDALAREQQAKQRREAEAALRRAERSRALDEIEAREQRERQEAEARAMDEGRARAAVEVARIEAEAKAEIEVANARRAHELEMLRVRTQHGHRRSRVVLALALGFALALGAVGIGRTTSKNISLERDLAAAVQQKDAMLRQSREFCSTCLGVLDKRVAVLRVRRFAGEGVAALNEVEAARRAVRRAVEGGPRAGEEPSVATAYCFSRIAALARALGHLEQESDAFERRTALDQRFLDLMAVWAKHRRTESATARAEAARRQAHRTGSRDSLVAYERALDRMRDILGGFDTAARGTRGSGTSPNAVFSSGLQPCADGDPVCGIDGHEL